MQELRCLFVREGWSEHLLWWWCHSCSRMHLEEPRQRDWVCLNIIHSGRESLSRVMWRGLRNVPLFSPLVASDVSLGKSSQSIHSTRSTSHDQCGWTTILESECIFSQLNGSQLRQVYSITHITVNHSNTTRKQSWNAQTPNLSDLREGMSSHYLLWMRILFNSNEACQKLKLNLFNSPISITSSASTFSISHTV